MKGVKSFANRLSIAKGRGGFRYRRLPGDIR